MNVTVTRADRRVEVHYKAVCVCASDEAGVPAKKSKRGEDFLEMKENPENPLRCPVRLYEFYLSKW